jgi:hypothetical protein
MAMYDTDDTASVPQESGFHRYLREKFAPWTRNRDEQEEGKFWKQQQLAQYFQSRKDEADRSSEMWTSRALEQQDGVLKAANALQKAKAFGSGDTGFLEADLAGRQTALRFAMDRVTKYSGDMDSIDALMPRLIATMSPPRQQAGAGKEQQFREQLAGGENFERPEYASPSDREAPRGGGEALADGAASLPGAVAGGDGDDTLPMWVMAASKAGLPMAGAKRVENGLTISTDEPEKAKQYQEALDSLGKQFGVQPPIFVDDRSVEEGVDRETQTRLEKEGEDWMKSQFDAYRSESGRLTRMQTQRETFGSKALATMSDAMMAATLSTIASDKDEPDNVLKTLAAAAAGAGPAERKRYIGEIQGRLDARIAEQEARTSEYEPGHAAYQKRGEKFGVRGAKRGEKKIAKENGEDITAFGERYAKAQGWDWSKKLSKEQLEEIRAAYGTE